jgi:hypothetical protein
MQKRKRAQQSSLTSFGFRSPSATGEVPVPPPHKKEKVTLAASLVCCPICLKVKQKSENFFFFLKSEIFLKNIPEIRINHHIDKECTPPTNSEACSREEQCEGPPTEVKPEDRDEEFGTTIQKKIEDRDEQVRTPDVNESSNALMTLMQAASSLNRKEREFIHLILKNDETLELVWSDSKRMLQGDDLPSVEFKCTFSGNMLFEKVHDVRVLFYEDPQVQKKACAQFVGPNFRLSPSQMKSSLQKCVRLSRVESAVKNAWYIMTREPSQVRTSNGALFNGPVELLRRLTVIMIEDSFLHANAPLLLWLTIACSKGFQIQHFALQLAILQVIFHSWKLFF